MLRIKLFEQFAEMGENEYYVEINMQIAINFMQRQGLVDINRGVIDWAVNGIKGIFSGYNVEILKKDGNKCLKIYNRSKVIEIWELSDEWYLIYINMNFYICDQIDGMKLLIAEFV